MINVPFFLLLYFICHNLLVSRSLYTVYSFERHRGCIWLYVFLGDRGPYVRSLNSTHFYFVILSSSSCPASLKCHPFKIENGIHFPFFLLLTQQRSDPFFKKILQKTFQRSPFSKIVMCNRLLLLIW